MQPDTTKRPDMDIEEDINLIFRHFAPLKAARGFIAYQSHDGYVTVSGNVGSPQAKHVLLDRIKLIPGVVDCEANSLYDDETIRIGLGNLLPDGVSANVLYGTVVLFGKLPNDNADVLKQMNAVSGIRKVVMSYRGVNID
jgi:hypothetical protein